MWASVTFLFLLKSILKCHVEDNEAAYIIVELKLYRVKIMPEMGFYRTRMVGEAEYDLFYCKEYGLSDNFLKLDF